MSWQMAEVFNELLNRPLAVDLNTLDVVLSVLSQKHHTEILDAKTGDKVYYTYDENRRTKTDPRNISRRAIDTYTVTPDGTAIVPVIGKLAHRHYGVNASSGIQSYTGIVSQLDAAQNDPDVSLILANFDTPGGGVTGLFETARTIYRMRGKKPMVALINEMATSAGYLLASAMDTIVVNENSMVANIGVIARAIDKSKQAEKEGIVTHVVFAGANKDLLAYDQVREKDIMWLQARVNEMYDRFVETVAEFRSGKLTEQAIRKNGAEIFFGSDAVKKGYADTIDSTLEFLDKPQKRFYTIGDEAATAESSTADDVEANKEAKNPMATKFSKATLAALGIESSGDVDNDIEAVETAVADLNQRATDSQAQLETLQDANSQLAERVETLEGNVETERQAKLDAEAKYFVDVECATKIPKAKRAWAIDKFKQDAEMFREMVTGMPDTIPAGSHSNVNPSNDTAGEPETHEDAELKGEKEALRAQLESEGRYSKEQIDKAIAEQYGE